MRLMVFFAVVCLFAGVLFGLAIKPEPTLAQSSVRPDIQVERLTDFTFAAARGNAVSVYRVEGDRIRTLGTVPIPTLGQ